MHQINMKNTKQCTSHSHSSIYIRCSKP